MRAPPLAALVRARPSGPFWARDWLAEVLSTCWPGWATHAEPGSACAWSVGCVLGAETLVQSRPRASAPDGRFLDDLLRTPAPCTVCAFGCARDDEGALPAPLPRFGRFVAAISPGGDVDSGKLRAELPDFLARAITTGSAEELLFLRCLAELHGRGALGSTYPDEADLRGAVERVWIGTGERHNMLLHDGRLLAMAHGHDVLLAFPTPPEPGRRQADTTGPRAGLFLFAPHGPEDAARSGAERVTPGVYTVQPARPLTLRRP